MLITGNVVLVGESLMVAAMMLFLIRNTTASLSVMLALPQPVYLAEVVLRPLLKYFFLA